MMPFSIPPIQQTDMETVNQCLQLIRRLKTISGNSFQSEDTAFGAKSILTSGNPKRQVLYWARLSMECVQGDKNVNCRRVVVVKIAMHISAEKEIVLSVTTSSIYTK